MTRRTKTRLNIWPFGTNQPLGRRVSYGKRRISELSRSSKRPVSAKAAAKAERERESERKERVFSDPNLERKLKTHYARGGTLNEFLAANPASYSAFFDSTSKGKARDYRGFKVWPVFGGWKTSLSALPTFGSEREVKQFIDTHLAKRNPAGTHGEFQRCVDAVSARGGAYDPRAVCASMERRKYGQAELTRRAKTGKRAAVKRGKLNPADAAAEVFEEFHGMPSTEIVEVTKRVHYHKNLAAVGRLEALVVMRPGGEHRLVGFKGAKLCTNERKNQLFVEGGDQALDSADFGYREWPHEKNTLGVVTRLEYFTTKKHLGKQGGTAIYFHEPGKAERGRSAGVGPDLIYDAVNEALEFSGGTYKILREGIDQ